MLVPFFKEFTHTNPRQQIFSSVEAGHALENASRAACKAEFFNQESFLVDLLKNLTQLNCIPSFFFLKIYYKK